MQRLFSMFPSGLPGFALVLLRASLALTILFHCYTRHGAVQIWFEVATVVLAVLLAVGVFTPVLATVVIAVQWIGLSGTTVADVVIVVASSANALALALLGPGAYSLDARRFGRRVVDLPSAEKK